LANNAKSDGLELSPELSLYLAALHDIISAYHQRLSEVTSPQVANQFLGNISDIAMRHLGFDKDKDSAEENARKMMATLGMKLETVKTGQNIDCKIECPFAEKVHPLLVSKNPICPITILVLGAVRLTDRGALATQITLNEKGTDAIIGPNPVKN
jgi:hypothetical protein